MKAALIKPPRFENLGTVGPFPSPPLGLAYIAAALEAAGHHIVVIDSTAQAPQQYIPFKPYGQFLPGHETLVTRGISYEETIALIPADVQMIGLHCMFSMNWFSDRHFIELLRQKFPHATLVAGGEHATGTPETCLQTSALDIVVKGEGEETITELAHALNNGLPIDGIDGIVYKYGGRIITTKPRERKRKLEDLPRPAWHLFPVEVYNAHQFAWSATTQKSLPVMATRGCPYTCTFCSSPQMWGTRYYMRAPEDVLDEMKQLHERYGIQNFDFYDLTAIISRDWIIRFGKLIVESKMDITWQIPAGTRTEVIDREVARWLYLSGCKNLVYAPESGSQKMLDAIKKKVQIPRMLTSIRQAKAENLNVMINTILGLPDETHLDIFKTLWFYLQTSALGVNSIAQSNFHPYSGSELFTRLTKEGKIDPHSDEFYLDMVYIDTNSRVPIYNSNISRMGYRIYLYITYLTFYGSNFLLRPWRLFKVLLNIRGCTYESRFEKHLGEYLRSFVNHKYKPVEGLPAQI